MAKGRFEKTGTRFLLYPQAPFLEGFSEPEVVTISSPVGSLGPGPQDERMYTVYPVGKPTHYGQHQTERGDSVLFLPPWTDEIYDPPEPGPDGHFDHLEPGTKQFEAAHVFASARFTLDVWEGYFDRQIPWHFREDYDRLEISLIPKVDNAFMGWGFLETGALYVDGNYRPFALNFDVVAHEIGHGIIYSEVGMPSRTEENPEYYGFHESAADLVALVAALHFNSVVDTVLGNTRGNLYTMNKLSRFAETSPNGQIRLAANDHVLSEFAEGWDSEHKLSQPLTGAMFDILVDVFHENLLEQGLIPPEMEDLSDKLEGSDDYSDIMQERFDHFYAQNPEGFREALLLARDYLGTYLADAWIMLTTETLSYKGVGEALLEIDNFITGGRYQTIIRNNFLSRDIGRVVAGPRVAKPDKTSHAFSDRTLSPRDFQR
ncbi:MAG: hypothetical protein AAF495_03535 [Pseudomonadota bacterium]